MYPHVWVTFVAKCSEYWKWCANATEGLQLPLSSMPVALVIFMAVDVTVSVMVVVVLVVEVAAVVVVARFAVVIT